MYYELINKIVDKEISEEQALELARKMTQDKLEEFICDFEMVYNMYDDPNNPDLYNRLSDLHWKMEKILEEKNKSQN